MTTKRNAEVVELRREVRLLRHFAFTGYGNANGLCAAGYPQVSGLICGLCSHDNSDGSACPRTPRAL